MANITRIKAGESNKKSAKSQTTAQPKTKSTSKSTKSAATKTPAKTKTKTLAKSQAKPTPKSQTKSAPKTTPKSQFKSESKPKTKKPFILFRPFIAIGRYVRESWHELRQVRWPSRKYTWKMTLAMLVYCAIFLIFIVLLDALFSLIFNNLLG